MFKVGVYLLDFVIEAPSKRPQAAVTVFDKAG